ncbi:MAG: plasmid partition protein ParG [Acidobacteriota bacterium]|jgi:predicted transcriptional regulator
MHILNVKISDELHKRFKLACVHEEKIMSDVVRKAIQEFVERSEKKRTKR